MYNINHFDTGGHIMKFAPKAEHSLNPLFWHHAESHEDILNEMQRMKEVGINDFVVEPRPHPDYLGDGWWSDMDFILEEAEKLDMLVWIFDDGDYPSGTADGRLAQKYPQHTKRYWIENHMDAHGPLPHAHFLIDEWMKEGESLFRIIAARRTDAREYELDSDTLVDLTHLVSHGRLYWAVPEGDWRIFVIKISPYGQEEHTKNYVNPLSYDGVGKYIELVHEEHYARYGHLFGTRIQGFFTDEPRFGNITGHTVVIGQDYMPMPYIDNLSDILSCSPLGDFTRLIPLLWYPDRQGICKDTRFLYMDTVSNLFAKNFIGQLGDWCRAHNVKLIGHVVEENGCHARLGYGSGHFFRSMEGMDMAGIDVVDNLMPEQTTGHFATQFNNFDCDFSHWGLAKMASSAAHVDPKKQGNTLCEAFGAYGWFEGLRLMKWITDHLAVQGVNIITPHAFSPAPFPDPDCPPHFYARGENPQFRYFHVWSNYTKRLVDALTDAAHIAPVAVVYHAEAEWGGDCEPFEKSVKVLAQHQIDCDVVCIDTLYESYIDNGLLHTETETFRALVVPYAQLIPPAFAKKLANFIEAGLPVYFTNSLPERCYFGSKADIPGAQVVKTGHLPQVLANLADIHCDITDPDLLYSHYQKQGMDIYLFVNQSTQHGIDTTITFQDNRPAIVYNAMDDSSLIASQQVSDGNSKIRLQLDAWESRIIVFGCDTDGLDKWEPEQNYVTYQTLDNDWNIGIATSSEYPTFRSVPFDCVGDLSRPEFLPDFSGTIRYQRTFWLQNIGDLLLDMGEAYEAISVYVNDTLVSELICPPYQVTLPAVLLHTGENKLTIDVTNTLVKAHHKNPFDRHFVQEPTGLLGPVVLKRK